MYSKSLYYKCNLATIGEFMAKMGRPTNELKPVKLQVRISVRELEILENYCKKNDCSKMQALRDGISLLEKEKKS